MIPRMKSVARFSHDSITIVIDYMLEIKTYYNSYAVNELEKRATDFILGIILHLITVIQINIIAFCLGKSDTGRGPLHPIMGFG